MKITVKQTSKTLANGENLISVYVYANGRYKTYSTSVSCTKANWNAKTSTVSSKDRKYKDKNETIQAKLEEVQRIYAVRESTEKAEKELRSKSPKDISFYDVIAAKINDDCYTENTKKGYRQIENYLRSKYPILTVTMLTKEWFDEFVQTLQSEKTIAQTNSYVRFLNYLIKYGLEIKLIKEYITFKYRPQKVTTAKELHLTNTELNLILMMYAEAKNAYNHLDKDLPREQEAVFLFILHLSFQGLAPCDMASLRVKDLIYEDVETNPIDPQREIMRLNETRKPLTKEIINIRLHRQKSHERVTIYCYKSIIDEVIEYFTSGKSKDDYLINCFKSSTTYTDKKKIQRLCYYYNSMQTALNRYYSTKCETLGMKPKRITYYMARRSFANKLYSMNINENIIKRLIGHKDSNLQIHYLADVEKIRQADIVARVLQPLT